jgi:hypothetical protein
MEIGSTWLLLQMDTHGFVDRGGSLYFTTSDCSGTPYAVLPTPLPLSFAIGDTYATVINGVLYYPDRGNLLPATVGHTAYYDPNGQIDVNGPCQGIHPFTGYALTQLRLSTLGFVAPFRISK